MLKSLLQYQVESIMDAHKYGRKGPCFECVLNGRGRRNRLVFKDHCVSCIGTKAEGILIEAGLPDSLAQALIINVKDKRSASAIKSTYEFFDDFAYNDDVKQNHDQIDATPGTAGNKKWTLGKGDWSVGLGEEI